MVVLKHSNVRSSDGVEPSKGISASMFSAVNEVTSVEDVPVTVKPLVSEVVTYRPIWQGLAPLSAMKVVPPDPYAKSGTYPYAWIVSEPTLTGKTPPRPIWPLLAEASDVTMQN